MSGSIDLGLSSTSRDMDRNWSKYPQWRIPMLRFPYTVQHTECDGGHLAKASREAAILRNLARLNIVGKQYAAVSLSLGTKFQDTFH